MTAPLPRRDAIGALFVRRLGGAAAVLAVAAGLVWLLGRLGIPLRVTRVDPRTKLPFEQRWGAVVLWLAAVYVGARVLDFLVFDVFSRWRRRAPAPALLRQLIGLAIFAIGASAIFKIILAFNLTALLTTSAVITAVVGLALQDTLGNLFAGLALHVERTVQVGDMVRAGETFGTVEELSWRAMKVRTVEGNLLLVPNSLAGRERLEVYPRPGAAIARTLHVPLDFGASPGEARDALEAAARGVPGLSRDREPRAYLKTFDAYAVTWELRYWLEDYAEYLDVDSQVRERVWYALERAGLKIAYPVIRQFQYAAGPLVTPSTRDAVVAAIADVDLFAPLSAAERERLADGAILRRFGPDETVVREGDGGTSMFLVASGRVGVSIHGAAGESSRKLTAMDAGAAFGEISLLTGEPRTATVRALTEARLIEIDKETLAPILRENPALVGAIEKTVAERLRGRAEAAQANRAAPAAEEPLDLAARIARFFGIRWHR